MDKLLELGSIIFLVRIIFNIILSKEVLLAVSQKISLSYLTQM